MDLLYKKSLCLYPKFLSRLWPQKFLLYTGSDNFLIFFFALRHQIRIIYIILIKWWYVNAQNLTHQLGHFENAHERMLKWEYLERHHYSYFILVKLPWKLQMIINEKLLKNQMFSKPLKVFIYVSTIHYLLAVETHRIDSLWCSVIDFTRSDQQMAKLITIINNERPNKTDFETGQAI